MLKQQVKEELYYLFSNKLIFLLIIMISIIGLSYSLQDIDVLKQNIKQFEKDKSLIYGEGSSFEEEAYNNDIKKEYSVMTEKEGDYQTEVVDNVIAYDKAEVEKQMGFFYGKYVFHMSLNTIYSIFVIMMAIVGVILITEDNENSVKRLKVARIGKDNYYISKVCAGVICTFIILFTSWMIVSCIYSIEYKACISKYTSIFKPQSIHSKSNVLMKLSVMYIIALFMLCIGIFVGTIIKKAFIAIVLLAVYGVFVPVKLKYQAGMLIESLSNRVFDNLSETHKVYDIPYKIGSYKAIFILLVYIILIVLFSKFINKKQSAY